MIVNMARKTEFIARADVVNLLHVNEDKAYNLLKALTRQGILSMVNKGRYAKYKLLLCFPLFTADRFSLQFVFFPLHL